MSVFKPKPRGPAPVTEQDLVVAVSDRMFEAWKSGDITGIGNHAQKIVKSFNPDEWIGYVDHDKELGLDHLYESFCRHRYLCKKKLRDKDKVDYKKARAKSDEKRRKEKPLNVRKITPTVPMAAWCWATVRMVENRGQRCRSRRLPGQKFCRKHMNYRDQHAFDERVKENGAHGMGKYSERLKPAGLAAAYEASLADPDLNSTKDLSALTEARIDDLLARLAGNNKSHHWEKAGELYEKMMAQWKNPSDDGDFDDCMLALGQVLDAGHKEEATWDQLMSLVDQRRRLVETESRTLERLGQTMTIEQTMAVMAVIVELIKIRVPDKNVVADLIHDMRELADRGPEVMKAKLKQVPKAIDVTPRTAYEEPE